MTQKMTNYYDFMVDELGINKEVIDFALDTMGAKIETLNDVLWWAMGESDIKGYMEEYYDTDY